MEAKQKEIQILNIPIEKYIELTGKPFSCYDIFDVSAVSAGYQYSHEFGTKDMNAVLQQAEDEIRGNAAKNGAFVVVNAEYSQAIGGAGSQYSGYADYSVIIKGIALKDKGG